MDERFVSFASLLGAAPSETASAPVAAHVPEPPDRVTHAAVFEELALLRVAALDAFERSAARALRELATEVLGRELALAPFDIEALVARALEAFAGAVPIRLVLSPADAIRVRVALPVRVDAALQAGDTIVEVGDGAFESLALFRLERIVSRALEDAA